MFEHVLDQRKVRSGCATFYSRAAGRRDLRGNPDASLHKVRDRPLYYSY